ncbi:PIG-L deacetylase family protein [Mariniphaga sediminis]|uniref:PIG-L deacetylase family protein n=1 Tax=Mariniphaga sediminis TaxID=1628158 RepID=UPI0035629EB3
MTSKQISRRGFVHSSMIGVGMLPLSSILGSNQLVDKSLNVVCVGAHPDDPETGCGGTLAKFSSQGHRVTIIYLTNGDAGIEGKSLKEAAAIRTEEARKACKILGAKPVFIGQIDGSSIADNSWFTKIQQVLEAEKPDILFSHWPIDSHKDHLVASILVQKAYLQMGAGFPLFFYEVCTGRQSQNFHPTDYVDITDVKEQKLKAVFCHASQGFVSKEYYQQDHGLMEDYRGLTIRVKAAEAFVRLTTPKGTII